MTASKKPVRNSASSSAIGAIAALLFAALTFLANAKAPSLPQRRFDEAIAVLLLCVFVGQLISERASPSLPQITLWVVVVQSIAFAASTVLAFPLFFKGGRVENVLTFPGTLAAILFRHLGLPNHSVIISLLVNVAAYSLLWYVVLQWLERAFGGRARH